MMTLVDVSQSETLHGCVADVASVQQGIYNGSSGVV